MIYDEIELMKLDLTEEDIHKQIAGIRKAFQQAKEKELKQVVLIYDYFWMKFIIDELKGYEFTVRPYPILATCDRVYIEVKLSEV